MSVYLGKYKEKRVEYEAEKSINGHVLITGASGTGKSNFLMNFIVGARNEGKKIMVMDFSGSFKDIKQEFHRNILDAPAIVEPFKLIRNTKKVDSEISYCCDFIKSVWRLGEAQKVCLIRALAGLNRSVEQSKVEHSLYRNLLIEENGEYKATWGMLLYNLELQESNKAMDLAGRFFEIATIVKARHDEKSEESEKDNEQMVIYDFPIMNVGLNEKIVELFLWDLWRKQVDSRISGNLEDVVVVLDECQNLNWKKGTITERIFSEGRKFGIHMVVSTQFLEGNFPKHVLTSFTQSSLRIVFTPPEQEIREVSKGIDAVSWKNWVRTLKRMRRGECLVSGVLDINGYTSKQKVIITVPLHQE